MSQHFFLYECFGLVGWFVCFPDGALPSIVKNFSEAISVLPRSNTTGPWNFPKFSSYRCLYGLPYAMQPLFFLYVGFVGISGSCSLFGRK